MPRGMPRAAAKIWLSMLVCVSLWTLLAAPRLERNASASPEGLRRTVALRVLTPLARFSESSGLGDVAQAIEELAGKDPRTRPGGELDVAEILEDEGFKVPDEEVFPSPSVPHERDKDRASRNRLREPTSAKRLRIAVIGDSLADGLGDALERATDRSLVHVLNVGRIATGLARADYFNWVGAMRDISTRYRPDLTIVMLGGNDNQSVVFPDGDVIMSGDPDWGSAYLGRAEALIDAGETSSFIWVGLPPVRDRGESSLFRDYNRIYERAVDRSRRGRYVDIWRMFSGRDGRYRPYGKGPDGHIQALRLGDGEHFTASGYDLIANRVMKVMKKWGLPRRAVQ